MTSFQIFIRLRSGFLLTQFFLGGHWDGAALGIFGLSMPALVTGILGYGGLVFHDTMTSVSPCILCRWGWDLLVKNTCR